MGIGSYEDAIMRIMRWNVGQVKYPITCAASMLARNNKAESIFFSSPFGFG